MGKGRVNAPSSAKDGIWDPSQKKEMKLLTETKERMLTGNRFRHRGEVGDPEGKFRQATSTRNMLEAPFSAPVRPGSPPVAYKNKEEAVYNQEYPFTQHDNRHFFQERGEYFGNGRDTRYLGRRLHPNIQRLHRTEQTFLHHHSRHPTRHDYNPITAVSYQPPGYTEAPQRRRFPKTYQTAQTPDSQQELAPWNSSPWRTPLHVLAVTQEPFLPDNKWRYSFHGSYKVCPSYDRKAYPKVPNVLNRYGADFATVSTAKLA
ncbi:unnamed protein product [Lymnaea stagnalis]|uniref:Domain of unknown function with conserved HDNR motif domain-containing protein n=1 Tax=Lymnaea stagnalis TaxID=6523 RepID=A0AAV2HHA1_LYMST